MTVTALPIHSMRDALDKLEYASVVLDSGRFALAHIMEDLPTDAGETHIIQCVIFTLDEAAANLKTGMEAVTFEHEAFKAWEAKNAHEAGEVSRPA